LRKDPAARSGAEKERNGKGLQQRGTKQSHELPEDERRSDSRAMSQNGAAVRDFEDRPSR